MRTFGVWKKWEWPRNGSGVMPTTTCGSPSIVRRLAEDVRVAAEARLPEAVAHDHACPGRGPIVDRGVEARTARERHAEGAEVVRGDEERRDAWRRLAVGCGRADLARSLAPSRDGQARLALTERLVVRVGPLFEGRFPGLGAKRAVGEDQQLDQPGRVDAPCGRGDGAPECGERDERAGADAE